MQVEAAQARAATGCHQGPDEHPVALRHHRQVRHPAAPPRLAGLGRQRPHGGEHHQRGSVPARVVAQVEVEGLGGGRAGVDPADPRGPQQGREGLRQATGPADDDVLATTRRQQRVAVTGQLVGGREGVGVRSQRGPPHLAEVAEQGPVGRQVEQEMALAQRLAGAR